jgi:signal transduction histidine kinase
MPNTFALNLKSPAKRIFTLVIISFAGLAIYFISQHYFSTIQEVQTLTLEHLHNVANTIALQIDGDEHDKMMQLHKAKDDIKHKNGDIIYAKIHAILKNNLVAANLKSPIYTFVYDSTSKSFNFGVTSSEQPYFRHQYSTPPSGLFENIEKGGQLAQYEDEFGSWLSAFTPIKDKEGKVVALLQVDEKFDSFMAHVNAKTVQNILISLVVFSVFVFLLFSYLKRILAQEQKTKERISEAYFDKKAISDRLQESEEQLKKYALKLEESNRELVDFANIASHDLRAPIRGIVSFVQLFERRSKDKFDPRDMEYFNFIKANANQSLQLIESLLNYSKVDKNIGNPLEMDVKDTVEKAKNNLLSIIEERNAVIEIGDMPTIQAHPLLIMQLFQNLINNGIKYNKSEQPTIQITVQYSKVEGYIYAVKDNGIGIATEYQQEVFAMFRRLHGAGEYEGSGIGLAFCKRIVQTYDGRMWMKSKEGEGSTFFFILPNAGVISKKEVSQMA